MVLVHECGQHGFSSASFQLHLLASSDDSALAVALVEPTLGHVLLTIALVSVHRLVLHACLWMAVDCVCV